MKCTDVTVGMQLHVDERELVAADALRDAKELSVSDRSVHRSQNYPQMKANIKNGLENEQEKIEVPEEGELTPLTPEKAMARTKERKSMPWRSAGKLRNKMKSGWTYMNRYECNNIMNRYQSNHISAMEKITESSCRTSRSSAWPGYIGEPSSALPRPKISTINQLDYHKCS